MVAKKIAGVALIVLGLILFFIGVMSNCIGCDPGAADLAGNIALAGIALGIIGILVLIWGFSRN